ncbi:protein SLOW GREEN 1, chloroplastic [Benincasa hispida]|uniref:protein SLOW GREEN 1, chloroplastic n=1 Tax=Benincasa hispida TaxID=102211 RepID=UPI001900972E|nr:protein SLOW GREEN 1, chloroplastic [Benincasa hispida]
MGSTSTSAFSVSSQIELLHGPKFSSYNVRALPNCRFSILQKNHKPTSQSLFYSAAKNFHSPIHNPPFSNLSESDIRRSTSTQIKIHKHYVERFVGFLVGSFIFMGCFNVRYARALPTQTSSKNPTMAEKSQALEEDSEEEMRERILEHDPSNIDTLKAVLYGKMRSGKTEEAIKYVKRLIDLEPDEVEWRLLLALYYETFGQLDTAKTLFMEILEKKPLLVRALHGLALVMHKNNEGESVFEMLNKALAIARDEKKLTEQRSIGILIAQMHVVKGELEEGLKKFQDLVDENPRDFRPYLCQGIIYSLLDKKKEAAEQFEAYRALVPDEFPQREFIDDVVLAAMTASREQFQKEFDAEFMHKK